MVVAQMLGASSNDRSVEKYVNACDTLFSKRKADDNEEYERWMYYFKNYFSNRYNTQYRGVFGSGVIFPFYAIGDEIRLSERQKDCTIDCRDMNDLKKRIKKLFRMWSGASYGRRFYPPI